MQTTWIHGSVTYRYSTCDDLAAIATMLSDSEVGHYLWFTPLPAEAIEAYFRPLLERQSAHLAGGELPVSAVFSVCDQEDRFLGQGAVLAVEGSPGGFEIGFQLTRAAWGRGLGTCLSRFLCAYAVELLDAYRIEGSCLEGNAGSRRLLRKLGLQLEGRRPGYRLKDGTRHTELCFGAVVESINRSAIRDYARQFGLRAPGPV